jgi:hypothetical protein
LIYYYTNTANLKICVMRSDLSLAYASLWRFFLRDCGPFRGAADKRASHSLASPAAAAKARECVAHPRLRDLFDRGPERRLLGRRER